MARLPAIDIAGSLSPFLIVIDDTGIAKAASGRLRGEIRAVPSGVLDAARRGGEQRVTWQPERGVRIASVIVPYAGSSGGFVIAGRSLREIEERVEKFQRLIGFLWLVTMVRAS